MEMKMKTNVKRQTWQIYLIFYRWQIKNTQDTLKHSFHSPYLTLTIMGEKFFFFQKMGGFSIQYNRCFCPFVLQGIIIDYIHVAPLCNPHRDATDLSFLACTWHATSTGYSYGPQITGIWHWHDPGPRSSKDRGPSDPRGVPWDQNFLLKNFLIPSCNDHILSILWGCFAKSAEKCN